MIRWVLRRVVGEQKWLQGIGEQCMGSVTSDEKCRQTRRVRSIFCRRCEQANLEALKRVRRAAT